MKKFVYENRYHDKIVFQQVSENTWHMYGFNPKWCRYGWPNDYSIAYDAYCIDEDDPIILDEFKKEVHKWYGEDKSVIAEKYGQMVKSDKSKIDMFDPSGGPYIAVGQYWEEMGGVITNINVTVEGLPGVVELTIKNKNNETNKQTV